MTGTVRIVWACAPSCGIQIKVSIVWPALVSGERPHLSAYITVRGITASVRCTTAWLRCMEADGCMAGALDILHRPNDGKIVWRNFERCEFVYCPFCGRRLEKK